MHAMHVTRITNSVGVGLWACNRTVYEQVMTALYPHPTALLVRWRGLRCSLRVGLSACNQLNLLLAKRYYPTVIFPLAA